MIRIRKTAAGKPAAVFFHFAIMRWYFSFACRAGYSAAMRRRNALGFSANSRLPCAAPLHLRKVPPVAARRLHRS
jgi:hypothetical protein